LLRSGLTFRKPSLSGSPRAFKPLRGHRPGYVSQALGIAPESPANSELHPPEDEPSDDLLDEAVDRINRIFVRQGVEVALDVGRYVLDTFFDGDPDRVGDRGKDSPTFQALSAREDLRMRPGWIWRAVRLVVQLQALPEAAATELPYTHHTLLLPIHSEDAKAELAQLAIDEGLSTREFEAKVKEARRAEKTDKRGGRKPLPAFVKTIRKVGRLVQDDDLWGDQEGIDDLDPEGAEVLYRAVTSMKLRCEELQKALQHKVPGFEPE
jgi:hypothetical protein